MIVAGHDTPQHVGLYQAPWRLTLGDVARAFCVMAGEGRPLTAFLRCTLQSRGWPAFAGHDTEGARHVASTSAISPVGITCRRLSKAAVRPGAWTCRRIAPGRRGGGLNWCMGSWPRSAGCWVEAGGAGEDAAPLGMAPCRRSRALLPHPITVEYGDIIGGGYFADILVEAAVVVELKAVRTLDSVHNAQRINYLKASGPRPCLLLDFGKHRVEIHRVANGVRSVHHTISVHLRASAVPISCFVRPARSKKLEPQMHADAR